MPFKNDSVDVWEWSTSRLITVTAFESGERVGSSILSMPAARELLNALTEAIANVDARDLQTGGLA